MIHRCNRRGLMDHQRSLFLPFSPARPLLILLLALLLPPSISESENQMYLECVNPTPYPCGGQYYSIYFPFGSPHRPQYCWHPWFYLECSPDGSALKINISDHEYNVKSIDYTSRVLTVVDPDFAGQSCPQAFPNTNLVSYFFNVSAAIDVNLTVLKCTKTPTLTALHEIGCLTGPLRLYYGVQLSAFVPDLSAICEQVGIIWINRSFAASLEKGDTQQLGAALQAGFDVTWTVGQDWCSNCNQSGGACGFNHDSPDLHTCYRSEGSNRIRNIAIGVGGGGAGFIVACFLCFFLYQRRKRRQRSNSSNFLIGTGTASSKPSSLKDPELGSTNYYTHVFSYEELQEATNGFDASRELGDGGFGTVYKGQLRDGRVVAVKRLYENNYKRVEQFLNEVDILSRLHHQNLVTLYGCTSRHSRELLLVYEFVPNGTVADHLHGPRAAEEALTWAVRLSIAIETADALAYLHAVEPQIIHRDVKTNNILLDSSFHVKVADFGLSRLFPVHATHVSTLPQGTPGYVDPEYHQCYQLTDKSDVYSFGVVLVELISSKPAVDISRSRHEINLANLAINKIQNRELEQLVDPGLGYQADWEMERMITLVAELAFRCLQGDSDMRPSIKDVLEELRSIQSRGEKVAEADVQTGEDTGLLKKTLPFSPDSVTVEWESRLTTPNTSA